MLRLIRFLRGYVVFEIIGRFPERFINLCMCSGRFVFDATPKEGGFTASLLIKDFREIRPLARRSKVKIRIKEKHGLPFIINKNRGRVGLLIGLVLFLIITQAMQSFVWTVEIHGAQTVSESIISQKLSAEGLYSGALKSKIDTWELERSIMESTEEIGWMSVNIIGTKAEVEIKEKDTKPDIPDFTAPCNIKAQRDGLILKMNVRKGRASASVGSAVMEGQLLVSSVVENALEEVFFVRADAEVIAETHRIKTFTASSCGQYKKPLKSVKRQSLIFFWAEIPFNFSSVKGEHSSRIVTEKLFLNDTSLELGTVTEYATEFGTADYEISEDALKKKLESEEMLYRLFALSDCEAVTPEKTYSKTKDGLLLTAEYTCREDIAEREELVVNE
ncbi:MAG: sporulation protein YqfD [Ruminococcus sp.]